MQMVKNRVGDVIDAVYKFATSNAKNYQDRQLLLELGGILEEDDGNQETKISFGIPTPKSELT